MKIMIISRHQKMLNKVKKLENKGIYKWFAWYSVTVYDENYDTKQIWLEFVEKQVFINWFGEGVSAIREVGSKTKFKFHRTIYEHFRLKY